MKKKYEEMVQCLKEAELKKSPIVLTRSEFEALLDNPLDFDRLYDENLISRLSESYFYIGCSEPEATLFLLNKHLPPGCFVIADSSAAYLNGQLFNFIPDKTQLVSANLDVLPARLDELFELRKVTTVEFTSGIESISYFGLGLVPAFSQERILLEEAKTFLSGRFSEVVKNFYLDHKFHEFKALDELAVILRLQREAEIVKACYYQCREMQNIH